MIGLNLSRVEGVIASVLGPGRFSVRLADGQSIPARLSRRLGFLHRRFVIGDPVLVGLAPLRAGTGLILTGDRSPGQARA